MNTFEKQISYKRLREIIAVNSREVVLWAGSGLSKPAGLPLWIGLKEDLIECCRDSIEGNEPESFKKKQKLIELAELEEDFWQSFSYLKKCLGRSSFQTFIEDAFKNANTCKVPKTYSQFWELGISGVITTNIDGLSARSFSQIRPGEPLIDFYGINIGQHTKVLQDTPPFVANLHGKIESEQSWVFTKEELEKTLSNQVYKTFLQTIFSKTSVVFCGASANDNAIKYHLDSLRNVGFQLHGHFWITSNPSEAIRTWADSTGISLIEYNARNNHEELNIILDSIKEYQAKDKPAEPIVADISGSKRNIPDLSPSELNAKPTNEIRIYLNRVASKILNSNRSDKNEAYESFRKKYAEGIFRCWFIQPGDRFFGYEIVDTLRQGAFGSLYKVRCSKGETRALKVLHLNIKDDVSKLDCFRRGVSSMRILTQNGVEGMVPLLDAWEIPTSILMDYIDGIDLSEAAYSQLCDSWNDRILYAHEIVSIIIRGHELDAQVLHRDLRPPNVLIEDPYSSSQKPKMKICDFDLSWHKNAVDTSIALESLNGYLAPEQLDSTLRDLSRSTYVDSFGFGMTLYFVLTLTNPVPYDQRNKDQWRDKLLMAARNKPCRRWLSLPRRFTRMIYFLTQDSQKKRWSLQNAKDELQRLQNALQGIQNITSAEIAAEELVHRTQKYRNDYRWDKVLLCANIDVRPGLKLQVKGDELNKTVIVVLDWQHLGDTQLKSLMKYLPQKIKSVLTDLRKEGWKVTDEIFSPGTNFYAVEIPLKKFNQSEKRFNRSAALLDDLIDAYSIR